MLRQEPSNNPYIVRVTGAATVRVEPDTVAVNFSVSEIKPHPKEAFDTVRETARKVQGFLATVPLQEAGSSNIALREEYRQVQDEQKLVGYRTTVDFYIVIADLSRMEEVLTGVVDAGASKIQATEFQTTQLKVLRAEARRQAVTDAREKAETYCAAAGVELGEAIRIEDLSEDVAPTFLRARNSGMYVGGAGDTQAFDPGRIAIRCSVTIAYKIKSAGAQS